MNESFRPLAFNILQCIIRHGMETSHAITEERVARVQEDCKRALKKLADKYPDEVPEWCKDLLD